jgi:hypothetical protein
VLRCPPACLNTRTIIATTVAAASIASSATETCADAKKIVPRTASRIVVKNLLKAFIQFLDLLFA